MYACAEYYVGVFALEKNERIISGFHRKVTIIDKETLQLVRRLSTV